MKFWRKVISNKTIVTNVTQSLPLSLLSHPVAYSDKNDDDNDDDDDVDFESIMMMMILITTKEDGKN